MASVKVKFRPSTVDGKEGRIYFQVIQNRVTRQLRTDYRIFKDEWLSETHSLASPSGARHNHLLTLHKQVDWDLKRLEKLIHRLNARKEGYTADDIVCAFRDNGGKQTLFSFMQQLIARLKQMGKARTAETYLATLRSFMHFRYGKDLRFDEMDSEMMQMYEAYLHNKGVVRNSSSFYLRILRAVYNRAVEQNLTVQRNPFKHVYTGIDKTAKRALPLAAIKRIKTLDLASQPHLQFARDLFLFSFYTRGMSFIDMAHLKKSDLREGTLSYRRRKTGQQLFIKWEKCMQEIVDAHPTERSEPHLLPILDASRDDTPTGYRTILLRINRHLKKIARMAGIQPALTLYCARHSWASAAKNKNIPVSVISEGMGHDSEATTQIYLASLDSALIDNANSLILSDL